MIILLRAIILVLGVLQTVGHLIVEEIDDELEHELYGAHFTLKFPLFLD